jgi:hypoxanthine phosphoribosyltransferase
MADIKEMHKNKLYVSYEDYGNLVNKLTNILRNEKDNFKWQFIYGPPLGALPMIAHIANNLDLRPITSFDQFINQYDIHAYSPDNLKILIVDDVADTGSTLMEITGFIRDHLYYTNTQYTIATLHFKPSCRVIPTFYAEEVPDTTWIVYPWEVKI